MAAFEDVIVSAGQVERDAAKQYLRNMEQRGRYRVEAWS
jgi:sulfite reductase alpha subunit-like flavoprotein